MVPRPLWWRKRFRPAEFLIEKLITAVAFLSFTFIVLIFIFVFREAAPIFSQPTQVAQEAVVVEEQETYGEEHLGEAQRQMLARENEGASLEKTGEGTASLENLSGKTWQPVSSIPKYGLMPLIVGSFKVTVVAIVVAAPIAILAALFTSAFAPKWAKEILKPAIEVLAGIPSVVVGFFALVVMASILQNFLGFDYRLNALVGGLALSLAVIPIIYTITEDALNAVPKVMTEASLALGATKWQTALFVVLPAATPGVFAAFLLGIGRAFGETMIVLMATGNAAMLSGIISEPVRTMSATVGAEMAEVVFGDTHYTVLFLIGSILFIFTFALNAVAELFVRKRLMKRFTGQ
jgi:phosphate transport system permease protein